MKFERGIDPKQAMGIGRVKDATEIEGIQTRALVRVFERGTWNDTSWSSRMDGIGMGYAGTEYRQVGEAQIQLELEPDMVHHLFEQMVLGWRGRPIMDKWVFWQFKKEQMKGKYTSAKVLEENIRVLYHPDERTVHTDTGIHLKTKDRMWDRLHYLAGQDVLFEGKFYQLPEDIIFDEF